MHPLWLIVLQAIRAHFAAAASFVGASQFEEAPGSGPAEQRPGRAGLLRPGWVIHRLTRPWDELSAAAASIVSFCFPLRPGPNTDGIVSGE